MFPFFLFYKVPRAIVNLVELLNIVPLRDLHKDKTLGCPTWFAKWVLFVLSVPKNYTREVIL